MITYYAFAQNKKGQVEQLHVVRPVGLPSIQVWTGKIYKSVKKAEDDMIALNCKNVKN